MHNFYISDSGVQLPSGTIFEPFKTTKLKGNGLGLALSLEIINAIFLSSWTGGGWVDLPIDGDKYEELLKEKCGGSFCC